MAYVRIVSWHIVRTWYRVPGRGVTLCGRPLDHPPEAPSIPTDEKSCETCLRIDRRATDAR